MKQFCLFLFLATAGQAQTGTRAVIRTVGQLDRDGTAQYSVYVASREEDLEGLTISAALPAGTRFLEQVHKPLDGVFEGVRDNVVTWTASRLERDVLMGPFVFRVKPDGSVKDLPETVAAAVNYQRPVPELVESPAPEGVLTALADRGTIVIDQRGTLDASGRNAPAAVGGTGFVLFVPEGAITQRTTITVARLPIDDKLPATDPPTWWCAQYQITSEPQVTFSKGVSFSAPTRRAVTPGVPMGVFLSPDQVSWTAVGASEGKVEARNIGFGVGFGGGFGGCAPQFGSLQCGFGGGFGFGGFGGFGYVEQDNLRSTGRGSQMGALGATAAGALATPPGIIAILIGLAR
jgi:hypothetical protein